MPKENQSAAAPDTKEAIAEQLRAKLAAEGLHLPHSADDLVDAYAVQVKRMRDAGEKLAREGLTVTDDEGREFENPAATTERMSANSAASLYKQICGLAQYVPLP